MSIVANKAVFCEMFYIRPYRRKGAHPEMSAFVLTPRVSSRLFAYNAYRDSDQYQDSC